MAFKHILTATALASLTLIASPVSALAAKTALETGMDAKEMQQVEVNGVVIENFSGAVIIKSTDKDKMVRVSITGEDDVLKQLILTDNFVSYKGQLYIAFEKEAPTLTDVNKLTLTLEVPSKMPLSLTLIGGKAEVGNRDTNDTTLKLNGGGDIVIDSVKNLVSTIDGAGEITIKKIDGDASFAIRGDGKYAVKSGAIPSLKASIQGTGLVDIVADVRDADLTSEGAGTINLTTVTGKLTESRSGAGSISIAKYEGSIKNSISGSGRLEMDCARKKN